MIGCVSGWVVTISWVSGLAVNDLMGLWEEESYRRSIDGSVSC